MEGSEREREKSTRKFRIYPTHFNDIDKTFVLGAPCKARLRSINQQNNVLNKENKLYHLDVQC